METDGRRSRLHVAMRRLPGLALFATAVACWPAAGTAFADTTITGAPQVGNTLSLSDLAALGGDPTTYTYQWDDCNNSGPCVPVAGDGTSSTYTLQTTDVGSTVEASITVPDPTTTTTTTTTTAGVGPVVWVASAAPAITGTAQQGQTLSVSNGTWAAASATTTYAYQWQDCDALGQNCSAPIGTSSTYTLQASDVGHTIVATVTAADGLGDVSAPSSSPAVGPVISNATTTTLVASPNSATADQVVTLIASVSSSAGAPPPAGAITVRNHGTAISGCAGLPVTPTGQTVTVVCSTSFSASTTTLKAAFVPATGSSLQDSTSPAVGVTISAAPDPTPTANPPSTGTVSGGSPAPAPSTSNVPGSKGVVTAIASTMQWTFHYTPSYTQVRALFLNGVPSQATVMVKCHGGGCPFASHNMVAATMRRCGAKTSGVCSTRGGLDLTRGFATRHLAVGTQITVVISRPSWIGKYYSFTVRAHRAPRIKIACLAPGGTRPGQGC